MTAPHTSPSPTQTSRTRLTLAVLTAWVPAVSIAMTGLAWRTRLPEVLPTHWGGFLTTPDQFAGTSAMWGWTFGVAVLAGIGAVVGAYLHRRAPTETAFWLAFAGGGGTFAAVWLTSATATLAAGSPADARPGWRPTHGRAGGSAG